MARKHQPGVAPPAPAAGPAPLASALSWLRALRDCGGSRNWNMVGSVYLTYLFQKVPVHIMKIYI